MMTGEQFKPIDAPYLVQWRDRLTDPKPVISVKAIKPAKVKARKKRKVKS